MAGRSDPQKINHKLIAVSCKARTTAIAITFVASLIMDERSRVYFFGLRCAGLVLICACVRPVKNGNTGRETLQITSLSRNSIPLNLPVIDRG